jgi:hypothetical protein
MKYFRAVYSNGYSGCEEYDYIKADSEEEAWDIFDESIESYGFYEPDSRFCDTSDDEEIESYQFGIRENSYIEEISKEEYDEEI